MSKLDLAHQLTAEEAQKRTDDHIRDFTRLERGWVGLGRDVEESVRLGVPAKLGMTMRAWLEATFPGNSASHVFRMLRSHRALKGVPEEILLTIPEANAHEMVKLNERDRNLVLAEAVSQKPKEFKETVAEIRARKYGITADRWRTFAVRVPEAVYDALIAAQEKMATVLELDLSDDEHRPARLVTVWEAIAVLINQASVENLKAETEGE